MKEIRTKGLRFLTFSLMFFRKMGVGEDIKRAGKRSRERKKEYSPQRGQLK
jgi:hypothetical protein